jgi:hypothetical protein
MAIEQFLAGTAFLKPGDVVQTIEKRSGPKEDKNAKPLGLMRIVSVRREPLSTITAEDVAREGYPGWTPAQFVQMLTSVYRISPDTVLTRIEFEPMNPR